LSPARSRGVTGVVLVVLGVVLGLGVSCNGFREDEVECEQAVNRLLECCPGFVSNEVNCNYSEQLDCSDRVTGRELPALSLDESRCVERTPCAELVDTGICVRAQNAKLRIVDEAGKTTSGARSEPVCK
jgi:hypothetical protein